MAMLPSVESKEAGYFISIVSLLLIKQFDRELFGKIKRGEAQLVEICNFVGTDVPAAESQPDEWDHQVLRTVVIWSQILKEDLPGQFTGAFSDRDFGLAGPRRDFVVTIIRNYLDVFQLPSEAD